jgi:hypothetical protein
MIITPDYVQLNFQLTNYTYLKNMALLVYPKGSIQSFQVQNKVQDKNTIFGFRHQIPEMYQKKPIISIMLNPINYYVSLYQWEIDNIDVEYDNFTDFYRGIQHRIIDICENVNLNFSPFIGLVSFRFLLTYSKDPFQTYKKILTQPNFYQTAEYKQQFNNITFIRNEKVEIDTFNLLAKYIPISKLDRTIQRIQPHNFINDKITIPYDIISDILLREQIVFDMFPNYRDLTTINSNIQLEY